MPRKVHAACSFATRSPLHCVNVIGAEAGQELCALAGQPSERGVTRSGKMVISAVRHGQQRHTPYEHLRREPPSADEKSFHETISITVGIMSEGSQPLALRPARPPLVPPRSGCRDSAKACSEARTRNVR